MAYKFPGEDVALSTALWILLAAGGIYYGISAGHFPWYIAVCVLNGIAGLGMWFQVRLAGFIFGGINALLASIGLFAIVSGGFTLKIAVQVAAMLFAAWTAYDWVSRKDP